MTERLNGEDGLGAIYPAMANAVMMYDALGYPPEHPHRALARRAVDKLLVIREDEAYCQPCVSPVWDTALASHALMEVGDKQAVDSARRGLAWLLPLQECDVKGIKRHQEVRPGGWAFQYRNAHYPDLDDTAVVVMAMERAREFAAGDQYDEAIARGIEWTAGLQSRNGGWAAFDADNVDHYLNNIPFADHGALLDPPTADVSARCISMLAQLGETRDSPRMRPPSSTSSASRWRREAGRPLGRELYLPALAVHVALNGAGFDATAPSVRKAADWLLAIQNPDGGWGEDCTSYKLDYRGYEQHMQHLADCLGAPGTDGGGRGGSFRGVARHRLSSADTGHDRPVAAAPIPAAHVSLRCLSRLSAVLSALGVGALSPTLRRSNVRRVVHGM